MLAKNYTDIGRIIGVESIKVQIDSSTSLPKLEECILKQKAKEKQKPKVESLIKNFVLFFVTLLTSQSENPKSRNRNSFSTLGP